MADFYKRKIEWLDSRFTEIAPLEYYRMIFNEGSFQKAIISRTVYFNTETEMIKKALCVTT